MFVLTFSPRGEKVNTNMALIHGQVKKSTLGKIVNNYRSRALWLKGLWLKGLVAPRPVAQVHKSDSFVMTGA